MPTNCCKKNLATKSAPATFDRHMSEQELQKLLAIKKCERPDEHKLAQIESNFRYALRIEKIRALSSPPAKIPLLTALFKWSPALAGAILLAAAAYQFNAASHSLADARHAEQTKTPALQQTLRQSPGVHYHSDPWAGAVPAVPSAYSRLRNAAFDATPVVFDESRITF